MTEEVQNDELIYIQFLTDLHSPRMSVKKKVYILALGGYVHPKMSSKNRPFHLSSATGPIRMPYTDNEP